MCETVSHFFCKSTFFAAVSAAQNGNFASLGTYAAGENFHYRSFACSAAGEIADTDNQTADGTVADHPLVIEPQSGLDGGTVKTRSNKENTEGKFIRFGMIFALDKFQETLFQIFCFEFAEKSH